MRIAIVIGFLAAAAPAIGQETGSVRTELTSVVSRSLDETTTIPGELKPYQRVDIYAKVTGFVEAVHVDRGSFVKVGQMLAEMSAPELEAQRAEAQAKIPVVAAQRIESQARLAAAESTHQRLAEAAKTPGAVAANDVFLAEQAVQAERARSDSLVNTIAAYEASVHALEEIEKYLDVAAPFSGVVTERQAHTGALVGPQGSAGMPLFTLEQVSRLRVVVAVPEAFRQSIRTGQKVQFSVAAFPSEVFAGTVARPAYAVDPKTRTMPVELDFDNSAMKLTPGMYAEVAWPIRRMGKTLFVPRTAIKETTEQIFVIRVSGGGAEWVSIRRGIADDDLTEVFGDLAEGDQIVLRATDEIRPGTQVMSR